MQCKTLLLMAREAAMGRSLDTVKAELLFLKAEMENVRKKGLPELPAPTGKIVVPLSVSDLLPVLVDDDGPTPLDSNWQKFVGTPRKHSKVHLRDPLRTTFTVCDWNWKSSQLAETCISLTRIDLKYEAQPCFWCSIGGRGKTMTKKKTAPEAVASRMSESSADDSDGPEGQESVDAALK